MPIDSDPIQAPLHQTHLRHSFRTEADLVHSLQHFGSRKKEMSKKAKQSTLQLKILKRMTSSTGILDFRE